MQISNNGFRLQMAKIQKLGMAKKLRYKLNESLKHSNLIFKLLRTFKHTQHKNARNNQLQDVRTDFENTSRCHMEASNTRFSRSNIQ